MGDHARGLWDAGFRIIYYNMGYGFDADLAITHALRDELGDAAVLWGDRGAFPPGAALIRLTMRGAC
jgi:hypothetical protein